MTLDSLDTAWLKVKATSSAVNGSPFWNCTPWRKSITSAVGDSHFQALANCGLYSPVRGLRQTSGSQILCARITPSRTLLWYWLMLGASLSEAYTSVSLALPASAGAGTKAGSKAQHAMPRGSILSQNRWVTFVMRFAFIPALPSKMVGEKTASQWRHAWVLREWILGRTWQHYNYRIPMPALPK